MALSEDRVIPAASINGGRDFGLQRIVAPEPEPLPWPEKAPLETRTTRQVEYLAQTYGSAYVPSWLTRPLVRTALLDGADDRKARLGSLVAGCTVDSDAAPIVIVRACGRTPGRLILHSVDRAGRPQGTDSLDVVGASVEGMVTSDRCEPGQHRLIGVRAGTTVAIYSLAEAAVTRRLDRMTFVTPAADLALSKWFAEAVMVTTDGAIVAWSAGAQGPAAIRLVGEAEGQAEWRGIVYGGHPRTVLVGNGRGVSMVDLRAPGMGPLLAQAAPGCAHTAIATHPSSDWLWGLGDTRRVSLIDTRMGRSAVTAWVHHAPQDDAPTHLLMADGAIMAMHRHAGELVAHHYDSRPSVTEAVGVPRQVLGLRGTSGLAGVAAVNADSGKLLVVAMATNGSVYAGDLVTAPANEAQRPAIIDAAAQHWDSRRQQALAYTIHDYTKAYNDLERVPVPAPADASVTVPHIKAARGPTFQRLRDAWDGVVRWKTLPAIPPPAQAGVRRALPVTTPRPSVAPKPVRARSLVKKAGF